MSALGQKQTCASQKAMSAQAAAYDAPYPDVRYKGGVRRFPNLVPEFVDSKGAAVGRAAREFWRNEWRGPSVMAIGMTDPVLGPFLAAWGKNDPFFLPAGAEAFKRDMPNAVIRFFDTGHFALETHAEEIGAAIRDFLAADKRHVNHRSISDKASA